MPRQRAFSSSPRSPCSLGRAERAPFSFIPAASLFPNSKQSIHITGLSSRSSWDFHPVTPLGSRDGEIPQSWRGPWLGVCRAVWSGWWLGCCSGVHLMPGFQLIIMRPVRGQKGPGLGSRAGPRHCAVPPSFVPRAHLRAVAHWLYPGGSPSLNDRSHCSRLPGNYSCEPVSAWSLKLPLVGPQLFPQPLPAPGEGPWGPRGGRPLALLASYQDWEKTTFFKKTQPNTNPSPLPPCAGGELFLPGTRLHDTPAGLSAAGAFGPSE